MIVVLDRLPMPPTLSDCFSNNKKTGGRFPTKEFKAFNRAVEDWRMENLAQANQARRLLVARFETEQKPIRMDRYFAFARERIIGLDRRAKAQDATNRIKAFDDAICKHILGTDDKWFYSGLCEKVEALDGKECVLVALSLMTRHQTLDDIRSSEPGVLGKPIPRAVAALRRGIYPLEYGTEDGRPLNVS